MEPVALHTARLELSVPTTDDIDAITAACQDPEIPRWTVVPSPYGVDDARTFIDLVATGWEQGEESVWAIRRHAALIGMIGLHDVRENAAGGQAEIGFWLVGDARRRGFVSEAAGAVIDWGFSRRGLARIEWRAVAGNAPSAAAARALGFQYEGLLRQAHSSPRGRADAWVAGLLRTDDRFPRPWPVLDTE